MKFRSLVSKVIASLFLVTAIAIPNQVSFARSLHPTGLKTLHESIPNIKMAPKLYTSSAALPASVDLTNQFPGVGNQGSLGSCVAFATGYADQTYEEELQWGWNLNTNSHIFSPAYIYDQIHVSNTADGGGCNFSDAFNLLEHQGCTTLSDMPYNGNDYGWQTQPTVQQKANAAAYKAKSWFQLANGDYNGIRSQIAAGNPVVIGIPVYPDFDNLDSSNPIYDDTSGTSRGNHALCVVGYDDSKNAVKIINSWGTGWGLNGYGWISYNLIKNQNLEAYVMTDNINSNYALGATVTASSSLENYGWSKKALVDGKTNSTTTSEGYSSQLGQTTNHTEWVQLNLGSNKTFSKVTLYPRNDSGNVGVGFPVNFKIQVWNGTTWLDRVTETGYPQPGNAGQSFTWGSSDTTNLIRIYATSLRPVQSNGYMMQLAEIEVN